MTTRELALRVHQWVERLFDALVDRERSERAMTLLLTGYLASWTLYAVIAKSSHDIHPDMGEIVAWSSEAGIGTPKHPPLAAWLVRIWFNVFPRQDWAYYLFAVLLATLALWVTWRLSARYLPHDKRVVGIALLTLVPFYNFHALKFNANTVLTPFWAMTTWWFLSSFETRRADWAILAGAAAALSVLGKYWSVILIVGLGVAALTDPRRKEYFNSLAPFLTLAVATVCLTPHIDWLIANGFVPFKYAMDAHPGTVISATKLAFGFIASSFGYLAAPIILSVIVARPQMAAIRDTLWPSSPERRIVVIAFAAPFLAAEFVAVVLRVDIASLWAVSTMTLFPVVLLASPLVTISRGAAIGLLGIAIAFPLIMIFISPLIAVLVHQRGLPDSQDQYQLVARAIESAWHRHSDKQLRIVGGYSTLVNGAAFYFVNQPLIFDMASPAQTPWVDDGLIKREGMVLVCPEQLFLCVPIMDGYTLYYHAVDAEYVTITKDYLGTYGTPVRYKIAIIPAQSK